MAARRTARSDSKAAPTLSKTRYQWGLQCAKRLWLDARHRELAAPPDVGLRARLAAGHRVGELARSRWAGAVLVTEPAARHERAEATTRRLLADATVPAICEGAFSFGNLRVRVDVLVRRGDAFDLVEVKSATRVKPEYESDAGVQLRVLEGAGVKVDRVGVLHLNREYRLGPSGYELDRLFTFTDISAAARAAAVAVDDNASRLRTVLASDRAPDVAVGRHCTAPYVCPFFRHCWRDVDYHHICELPALSDAQYRRLQEAGVRDVAALDKCTVTLDAQQELVRACVANNRRFVDEDALRDVLDALEYPITCLAVTFARIALPVFEGDRPYEPIPVAWARSTLDIDGTVVRDAFAPGDVDDPRPAFFQSLTESLPPSGSVVFGDSADLETVLAVAARSAPMLAGRLRSSIGGLTDAVKTHFYDPATFGGFRLDVAQGAQAGTAAQAGRSDASAAFGEWCARGCKRSRRMELAAALCGDAEFRCDILVDFLNGLLGLIDTCDDDSAG